MEHFKELLKEHHEWPCRYQFKFVVPAAKVDEVKALLPGADVATRASSNGKYISVSLTALMASPDDVVAIHQKASAIEGLIAL